jgi:biopolymer transport protein ExbD/biopolymer transport protein TolR
MKVTLGVCLLVLASTVVMVGQDTRKPVLRPGISVQMLKDSHAVAMPEADADDATVVVITRDGKVFLGTEPVEVTALRNVKAGVVYVKADARATFQNVLTVLDALRGKSVVLLTAPLSQAEQGKMMPPYGVKVSLGE